MTSRSPVIVRETVLPNHGLIAYPDDPILVTGSGGFIGSRVVRCLLEFGFRNIVCLVRPAGSRSGLAHIVSQHPDTQIRVVEGNLLSRDDCRTATRDAAVIYHLAAGTEKTFAGCFLNSVVTTRNLIESIPQHRRLKRFVNVSSFAVYSNFRLRRGALLDETCELETEHVLRNEPYAYAKLKQDELVQEYSARLNMPYVIVRPGAVYGPGKSELTGRVGISTFGFFLQPGGRNRIPFTHVDNCARAIVLAGIVKGVDGQVFNVVDDNLPSGYEFVRAYRRHVGPLRGLRVPYRSFYYFCWLWEAYARRSDGQLPAAFNRRKCAAYWKGNRYSNEKLKTLLGWRPSVSYHDGSSMYFEYLKGLRAC
jgi:nucleoside-diphosphate-sugar epimerase